MSDRTENSFQVDGLHVHVFPTTADLASAASSDAAAALKSAVAERGRARAIIATGNSQDAFLAHLTRSSGIDWNAVELFHMDEYLGIAMSHSASFRRYLKERAFDVVHPAASHYLEGDAMEPLNAIRRYVEELASDPVDICCLGIGENGHIAFSDPAVADFQDPEPIKIVKNLTKNAGNNRSEKVTSRTSMPCPCTQ